MARPVARAASMVGACVQAALLREHGGEPEFEAAARSSMRRGPHAAWCTLTRNWCWRRAIVRRKFVFVRLGGSR